MKNKGRQWSWTRMAYTMIIALGAGAGFEGREPAPPSTPAVQVRVNTITAFAVPLVGQRVRVVDGVVSRIASPRLVVLSSSSPDVPLSGSSTVAVIVESGRPTIVRGEQVTVTGVVHGFLTQQEEIGLPLIGALTMEEREATRKRPVIVASSATSFAKR
jgi:hypothetical protein